MASPSSAVQPSGKDTNESNGSFGLFKKYVVSGTQEFRQIFLYPMCSGIMTGVGFTVGKHFAEIYFFGKPDTPATSPTTSTATS